ncbi:S-adenosyl-L-methionine-dependent methyltransferase, partial [Aureobasidium melanogenum]
MYQSCFSLVSVPLISQFTEMFRLRLASLFFLKVTLPSMTVPCFRACSSFSVASIIKTPQRQWVSGPKGLVVKKTVLSSSDLGGLMPRSMPAGISSLRDCRKRVSNQVQKPSRLSMSLLRVKLTSEVKSRSATVTVWRSRTLKGSSSSPSWRSCRNRRRLSRR